MATMRERFEKLQRHSVISCTGAVLCEAFECADVLALVDEVEQKRAAQVNELQRAYLSMRGNASRASDWSRLYDAILAMSDARAEAARVKG